MPPQWTPTPGLGQAVYEAGFVYDPHQDITYSRMDARQRGFGYAFGYDEASVAMSSALDCEPIFFDYNGKHWMIELWKGQYGLETGCEIGVYTRAIPGPLYYRLFDEAIGDRGAPVASHNLFYDCASDSDRLVLETTLRRNDQVLFTRGPELHWWLTGFRWGVFSNPEDLSVDITITFKDDAMREAFDQGIGGGQGYPGYAVNGNTVSFTFDTAFAVPKPVSKEALAAAQAANRRIVDFYNETPRPNNDPNQIDDDYLRFVGLGFLNSRYVRGQRLSERAIEVASADQSVVRDISTGLHVSQDSVTRWLYNSRAVSPLPPRPERSLDLALGADVYPLAAERVDIGQVAPPPADVSCYVTIDNTWGPSDMLLVSYTADGGHWDLSPPSLIPRGGLARFVLAAEEGVCAGVATYRYCDTSLAVKTVRFSFTNSQGSPRRRSSVSRPGDWKCVETDSDPTFPRAMSRPAPQSRYVRYLINEHRQVARTRKDATGHITHLCGRPGTYWAPVKVADAISQISRGKIAYFVRAEGSEALIQVVNGPNGPYLRKARTASSANSLANLPSDKSG